MDQSDDTRPGWIPAPELARTPEEERRLSRQLNDVVMAEVEAVAGPIEYETLRIPRIPPGFSDLADRLVARAEVRGDSRTALQMALAGWQGLRAVEIVRARVRDVDFGTREMRVRSKVGVRTVVLDERVMTRLQKYLDKHPHRRGWLIAD